MDNMQLVLQVHDSILVQCFPEDVNTVIQELHKRLYRPITINNITHSIPVDFQVGYNWGKAKPANPNGLADWKMTDTWRAPAGTESGIGARSRKDS